MQNNTTITAIVASKLLINFSNGMKEILALLIEDDIRITRLVRTLGNIGIDATDYLPHKSMIVFRMAQVDYDQHSDAYHTRVENAADQIQSSIPAASEEILLWLLTIKQ